VTLGLVYCTKWTKVVQNTIWQSPDRNYLPLDSNVTDGGRRARQSLGLVVLITFRVKRSWGEMYIGHGRLCVCLSVPRRVPTLLHGCKLGE